MGTMVRYKRRVAVRVSDASIPATMAAARAASAEADAEITASSIRCVKTAAESLSAAPRASCAVSLSRSFFPACEAALAALDGVLSFMVVVLPCRVLSGLVKVQGEGGL